MFKLPFLKEKVIAEYKFTFPAKLVYVNDVKEKFIEICRENGFIYKDLNNILIVIDEVCSNIIKHAYKDSEGDMEFEVKITQRGMHIKVVDHGKSFNWKAFKTPDLNRYVRIGKKGGLGLWIIRKLTDKSDYKVTDKGNELYLVKYHTKPSIFQRLFNVLSAKGIKEKFVLAATLFILVLVTGVYIYFIQHERFALKEKFIQYNIDLVKGIAKSSKDKIITGNYLSLIKLIQEIQKNNENLKDIFIVNNKNIIIAHNNPDYLYTKYTKIQNKDFIKNTDKFTFFKYKKNNKNIYAITTPIYFQNKFLGEVYLTFTENALKKVIASKKINILVLSLLMLLIATVGIYLLMALIIKPLESLREGVIAIGEGRLDHKIEIEGEDEFSQIASAFNEMAKKLKGVQASLLEQEKLQQEIQVAKEIQQTLLPKSIPEAEGFDISSLYRAAKEVGGDYYDIFKVGKHLVGIIVADVSGKGVPGSLVMTTTRAAVRLLAQGNKSAKNVMVKVNEFVKEDMKKGMFVTAFYLILDSLSRKISFVSAGHNPMILYRAKEKKVYYIKPKGFPLGLNLPDDALFRKVMTEEKVRLEKNDLLVVYTDGITEAMNNNREQFGEKRFVEVIKKYGELSTVEFIEKLNEELKNFTKGYPQNDDITIVAIKEKKTKNSVVKSVEKKIKLLKKKGKTLKEIEKELDIDIEKYKKLKLKLKEKEKIRFLTFEEKKELMGLIIKYPEWSVKKYAEEINKKYKKKISEKIIFNELKRLNLTNKNARKNYSKER